RTPVLSKTAARRLFAVALVVAAVGIAVGVGVALKSGPFEVDRCVLAEGIDWQHDLRSRGMPAFLTEAGMYDYLAEWQARKHAFLLVEVHIADAKPATKEAAAWNLVWPGGRRQTPDRIVHVHNILP